MIVFQKTMPNGGLGLFHKASKMTLTGAGIEVLVDSFHLPAMDFVTWQDTYLLPPPFSAETLDEVEELLVQPGAPFGGGVHVPPAASSLEEARARAWARVKDTRATMESTGVIDTPSGPVQTSAASLVRLNTLANGDRKETELTMADNTVATVNVTQLRQIIGRAGDYLDALNQKAQALRALIDAAENADDVATIDLGHGWPAQAALSPPTP